MVESWLTRVGLPRSRTITEAALRGMQQRTAIARALANDPSMLCSMTVRRARQQTRALMKELLLGIWERERKTVLFVTHDIERRFSSRRACL